MQLIETLVIPELQPARKHPTVFEKFDALQTGDAFLLINDHDPIPLYYEMKAERGDVFEWIKLENGPEVWKVEIRKTGEANTATPAAEEKTADNTSAIFVLNVTLIEPRLKHPTIFRYFDDLKGGEAFQILNDHDPKPLYYQLIAERGNIFTWEYLESGPAWWRVQIRKVNTDAGETVGQIAAKDLRKAEVFRKYGIDFCCGGKKTLKQVCDEKGLDIAAVEAALDNAQATQKAGEHFDRWNLDFLTDYIYNKHHVYYYDEGPVIADLLTKVLMRHGDHYPVLNHIYELYKTLAEELGGHFAKEEKIVFPFIKELVQAKATGNTEALHSQFSLTAPVKMMEEEHEAAGEILEALQKLTNGYNAPEGACNSFQFLYQKLKALDEDLHQHIHLENNILFPRALALEKELR
ncbi:MAG TPA: iron-sulfur cluster repair di-iron protein [Flavisolibacter sp.]|jgi:regulator of cell morphogenesis and NO signaling|nr:iron-sulfur cluster repair di-iron protein [Flavisolibacter sp.]